MQQIPYQPERNIQAALNSLNQFSETRSKGTTGQTSTQQSDTFQESSSLQQLDSISTGLSRSHNISESDARMVTGKAFADMSVGGGFGKMGGRIGSHMSMSKNANSSIGDAYNDAVNQMSKMDVGSMKQEMQSYATSHSVGKTDSENSSFADSISAHLNSATKHSEQAQQSYSTAQSFDKAESRMKSDSFALSEDLGVRFSNWLLDEHNGDTSAYHMEMDAMAVNPEYPEYRINEFLSQNHDSLLSDINGINDITL